MKNSSGNHLLSVGIAVACLAATLPVSAQTEAEMRAMQQALNKQVLEQPFSVEDEAKIDAYVKEAMKKDLKPEVTKAPSYWQPGYTCANIYSYGWSAYRNCRYYLRYYGRYW